MQTTNDKSLEYNLGVLKKHDSRITRVIQTAGHAVVYVYKDDSGADSPWERHNVEGALFVVERSEAPRFQLWILNRLSTDNLVENVTADFAIEVSEEFLLYKNDLGEVLGLWFYNSADRDAIAALIQGLVDQEQVTPGDSGAQAAQPPATGPSSTVDAFFAAARNATAQQIQSPPTAPQPAAVPTPQPLTDDAIGLLSRLQVGGQAARSPSAPAQPAPMGSPVGVPRVQLDAALREAVRAAVVRVVSEDRFMAIVEEEYSRRVGAQPVASPVGSPAPPAGTGVAPAVDPKDGNALLQHLLSGVAKPQ